VTHTMPDSAESCDVEGDGEPPRLFHLESYAHLLKTMPPSPGTGTVSGARAHRTSSNDAAIDAIVVPTIRSAEQLGPAVRLAKQLRCQLIALYTKTCPDGLSEILAQVQPGPATALAIRPGAARLLDVGSAIPPDPVSSAAIDISRKRNLGLMIGHACGWTRMLFLDDDIRSLSSEKVRSAAVLLSQCTVVGLQVTEFPDASVVGHARRMTEGGRTPFISGGSMLVNPQRMRGFFPPVYHEDWLCIMDHIRYGEVAIAGSVKQLRYEPFTTETRAQLEEFGDILAFGLLWLVNAKHDLSTDEQSYWNEATKQQFWHDILQRRAALLNDLSRRLERHSETLPLQSIRAARKRCYELSPNEFVSFMEKWLESLTTWRTRLAGLPRADSVAKALAELGLLHVVTMHDERRPRVRALQGKWQHVRTEAADGIQRRLSARLDRRFQLGRVVVPGGGAGGRAQRPAARGGHAEHEDGAAAAS
jgi:hypothetical protein